MSMITLEHSAVSLIKLGFDEKKFKEVIPYILEPDAIRRYSGPRVLSHFEKIGNDVSWMKFPTRENLKKVNKENIWTLCEHHLAEGYLNSVIGEETQISVYETYNKHLDPVNYIAVKNHLIQDFEFDIFVRQVFDCSRRYMDIYKFNGEQLDGKGMRELVQKLSEYGLYRLAYLVYKESGIVINQQWYDENVKKALEQAYSEDLAEGTYKYMKIPEKINQWITEKDFDHFDEGLIPVEVYDDLYTKVLKKMHTM